MKEKKVPKEAYEYGSRGIYRVDDGCVWMWYAAVSPEDAYKQHVYHETEIAAVDKDDVEPMDELVIELVDPEKEMTIDWDGVEITLYPHQWYEILMGTLHNDGKCKILSCSEF